SRTGSRAARPRAGPPPRRASRSSTRCRRRGGARAHANAPRNAGVCKSRRVTSIQVDPKLVEERIFTLARYGAHGETGVWRTVYSPEWEAAQAQVEEWCRGIGLATRRDAVGSVWGRLEGSEGGPAIVSGSHIDSQTPGGRYDGALGVIAALTAVQCLREQAGEPRRALEVVSLCEEEASRFHAANFWGSRAITGKVRPQDLEEIRDADGV